jgi:hypothetical protein
MAHIGLTIQIAARLEDVWRHLADIPSHTEWMQDAIAIRSTSAARAGVGAAFDCDTRVGPFRTTDRLVVTEWVENQTIAIEHRGVVTGTGRFRAESESPRRTVLRWDENLRFPWWLGGEVVGVASAPVLRRIWRGNLRRLSRMIESDPAANQQSG